MPSGGRSYLNVADIKADVLGDLNLPSGRQVQQQVRPLPESSAAASMRPSDHVIRSPAKGD
jgi:hypothetical protein